MAGGFFTTEPPASFPLSDEATRTGRSRLISSGETATAIRHGYHSCLFMVPESAQYPLAAQRTRLTDRTEVFLGPRTPGGPSLGPQTFPRATAARGARAGLSLNSCEASEVWQSSRARRWSTFMTPGQSPEERMSQFCWKLHPLAPRHRWASDPGRRPAPSPRRGQVRNEICLCHVNCHNG